MVWVRKETALEGTARKLNEKWDGPYRVEKVLRGGSAYILRSLKQNDLTLKRAVEKVKRCEGYEEYLLGEEVGETQPQTPPVVKPQRVRRPPRRLVEET